MNDDLINTAFSPAQIPGEITVGCHVRRKRGKQHLGRVTRVREAWDRDGRKLVRIARIEWKGGSRFGGAITEVRTTDLVKVEGDGSSDQ